MSLAMDIPKINITQETEDIDDDDDQNYLSLGEALTDIEDLDDDSTTKTNSVKRKSKLKIKLVEDGYTTEYEDVQASDNEDDYEKIVKHKNPISIDDLDLDGGVFEESYKSTNIDDTTNKMKSRKKLKTQSSVIESFDHKNPEFKVVENKSDEEEFDTESEISSTEAENIDTYEIDQSVVFDNIHPNHILNNFSNLNVNDGGCGFLTTPSMSPNLSDFTDVEIINSDSDEDISQKKKVKRKRHTNKRIQAVTDVEDLELTDPEVKQHSHTKKNKRNRHIANMKKSYSVPFDSDNDDDNKLSFPICKKIAGKLNKTLAVPEFDKNAETDIEEFENAEDIPPQEDSIEIDPESEEKINAVISFYSQISESHSVKSTDIQKTESEELEDKETKKIPQKIEKRSKMKKVVNKPPPPQNNFLNVVEEDSGHTDCENLDSESEEESVNEPSSLLEEKSDKLTDEEDFENDSFNEYNLPDLELPKVVRNMIILKDDETLPTIQIIPLKDSSSEDNEHIENPETDEESVSEAEDAYEYHFGNKEEVEVPVYDWGSVDICEHTQSKNPKKDNIRDAGTDTEELYLDNPQKRRKPPKFKHLHEKFVKEKEKARLTVEENKKSVTDTEDLNLSDDNTQPRRFLELPTDDVDGGTDVEILDDPEDLIASKIRPLSCTPQYLREMEGEFVSSKEGLGPFSKNDRLNTLKSFKKLPDYVVTPTHSDSEELVASTDEDFTTYSRAETATPSQVRREMDQCIVSEVRDETKKKFNTEDCMYLKGGGYFCQATDVEELSEEDFIIANGAVCDFMRRSFEEGMAFRKGEGVGTKLVWLFFSNYNVFFSNSLLLFFSINF